MYSDEHYPLYLDDYQTQRPPDHRNINTDLYLGDETAVNFAAPTHNWPDRDQDTTDSRLTAAPTRSRSSTNPNGLLRGRHPQMGRGPPPFAPPVSLSRAASLNTLSHEHVHPQNQRSRSANFTPITEEYYPTAFSSNGYSHPAQGPLPSQAPPEHRATSDQQLRAMLEALTLENRALKAQISLPTANSTMPAVPDAPAPPTSDNSSRGGLSSRGKIRPNRGSTRGKRQPSSRTIAFESDHSDAESDAQNPAVYLDSKNCTTADLKKARTAIQSFVTKSLRDVCGVTSKDIWPDPDERRVNEITGELYLTPVFASDVTDLRNERLFTAVAERAYTDLRHRSNQPKPARNVNATWDVGLLQDMAKDSFRNLKPKWKAQVDAAARARNEVKKQYNRRVQRRVAKADNLKEAVEVYSAQHNLDPNVVKEMIYEEHMSDELSGPDSDDEIHESEAAWKREMAKAAGYLDLSQKALDELQILEVVTPDWRSEKMSNMFHDLHRVYSEAQSKSDKNKIIFTRVRNTGRPCRRIPAAAPYNFGIAEGWLERARADSENEALLQGWGNFENPPGFGVSTLEVTPNEETPADTMTLVNEELGELLALADPLAATS